MKKEETLITPKTYTASTLIEEIDTEDFYTVTQFSNWKIFVLSRINILSAFVAIASWLSMSTKGMPNLLPANWYEMFTLTIAIIIIFERTFTKNHKNLI